MFKVSEWQQKKKCNLVQNSSYVQFATLQIIKEKCVAGSGASGSNMVISRCRLLGGCSVLGRCCAPKPGALQLFMDIVLVHATAAGTIVVVFTTAQLTRPRSNPMPRSAIIVPLNFANFSFIFTKQKRVF